MSASPEQHRECVVAALNMLKGAANGSSFKDAKGEQAIVVRSKFLIELIDTVLVELVRSPVVVKL